MWKRRLSQGDLHGTQEATRLRCAHVIHLQCRLHNQNEKRSRFIYSHPVPVTKILQLCSEMNVVTSVEVHRHGYTVMATATPCNAANVKGLLPIHRCVYLLPSH